MFIQFKCLKLLFYSSKVFPQPMRSLFGQIQFTPLKNVTLMIGLWWDLTNYLNKASYNHIVFQELGLRTDSKAKDLFMIQPRFQLTWDISGKKTDIIGLRGGLFAVNPVNYTQLCYNLLITQKLRIGVNFIYSHTTNNYTYINKNLVDQPIFTLNNEAGKSVFVPANSISAKRITNSVISNTMSKCG